MAGIARRVGSAKPITKSREKLATWQRARELDRQARELAERQGEPLTTETYGKLMEEKR